MGKYKVLIVDDHALVREGIIALISNSPHIYIGGSAGSAEEAYEKIEHIQPHVVLMDILMPKIDGIEAIKVLKEKYPHIQFIILSMEVNEAYIQEGIKAGAMGYLPKDTKRQELIEAIETVAEGGKYFNEKISEIIFEKFYKKSTQAEKYAEAEKPLSSREKEVLSMLASGMSKQEIADKLFISIRTIDTHRTNIMTKLELRNTVDLVRYAIKNQLIDLD